MNIAQIAKSLLSIAVVVLVVSLPCSIQAQTAEPVVGKAFYKFTHQYDTTNTSLIKRETYVLLLGKTSSVYKSYDRMIQDSAMLAGMKSSGSLTVPAGKRADGEELFTYLAAQKNFLRVRILGNYIVEKPYDKPDWTVSKETKKIANLDCQKATTNFLGREYTAWFSTSLPFQAGPWKLKGLPGLIVSAYDKTGRIKFELSSFEQVKETAEKTTWNKRLVQISWEDYKKIAKAAEDDPIGFAEKRFGASISTSAPMLHRNVLAPGKNVNFPLEVSSSQ